MRPPPGSSLAPQPVSGLRLGRLGGVPLTVHPSWVVSLLILTWFAREILAPGLAISSARLVLLSVALALFLTACIVAHELAHTLVARGYRLPVGGITLFAFGGVSQIEREAPGPAAEFRLAVAGPLASLFLAAALGIVSRSTLDGTVLHDSASLAASFNLIVAFFNLVPAFPMDGGRILRSALWAGGGSRPRATRWAVYAGRTFAAFLIVLGARAALLSLAQAEGGSAAGLYSVAIGLFLYRASGVAGKAEGGESPNRGGDREDARR